VDPDTRGAFCIALGVLEDERAQRTMRALAVDRSLPAEVRADACTALGLVGLPTPEVRAALAEALAARSSEVLRRQASRALGLLGDVSAVPTLLAELEGGGPDHVLARVAIALGDVGDVSAVAPLCARVEDRRASDLSRAIAVAALGLLGDLEPVPSLSRLGVDSNHLAVTNAVHEALSLL
jgi:HEAT repeat protein